VNINQRINKHLCILFLSFGFLGFSQAFAQQTPLDKSLAPSAAEDDVSNVFKDMGVVQRRAMPKSSRFLISNYGSLDFSDGPYSMYGFNIDLGFALSDFWELYLNTTPFFVTNPRSIVGKVRDLAQELDPTKDVAFDLAKPRYLLGGTLLWAPAYGKDSIGSRHVVRSDTFFKLGVMQTFFDGGLKGLKFHAGVGKTYFLTRWLGFRITASANYLKTFFRFSEADAYSGSYGFFGIVEAGLVFYM